MNIPSVMKVERRTGHSYHHGHTKRRAKAWGGAESRRTDYQGMQPSASPSEFPVFLSHGIRGQCAKDGHLVTNSAVPFLQLPSPGYHAVRLLYMTNQFKRVRPNISNQFQKELKRL